MREHPVDRNSAIPQGRTSVENQTIRIGPYESGRGGRAASVCSLGIPFPSFGIIIAAPSAQKSGRWRRVGACNRHTRTPPVPVMIPRVLGFPVRVGTLLLKSSPPEGRLFTLNLILQEPRDYLVTAWTADCNLGMYLTLHRGQV